MNSKAHETLKQELQKEPDASKLEQLASALLSRLLDVPIAIASSGYQYGGDAGPAGHQGRRFRLECKKYSDTTHTNERELLGEIDQALSRDRALEAWLLVATRTVPEQTRQSLVLHGEEHGIPIVVIDWSDSDISPLAALCSFGPDLVETKFSSTAGAAARALHSTSHGIVNRIRRDLESWCLGFESLRRQSLDKLDEIWNSPRESNASLGQNAAGGAIAKRIARSNVQETLGNWWQTLAGTDTPAAVTGLEGTGKTWATLNWLIDNKQNQPIVLIVPSSAVMSMYGISESSVKRLLADRMYEVSRVRDSEYWQQRLDRLLKRPTEEGPVLTIFFDGLNQEPTVEWVRLLKIFQAGAFSDRVRVMFTTRQHHFQNKLAMLSGLVVPPVSVVVGRYDDMPGGELDQMLAYEGLVRDDLHPDVLDMARTPRLFDLVMRFRAKLVEGERVTVHRLLWEYGRDTLGVRSERSFSEEDWREWLREVASAYREGIRRYSTTTLSQTVNRPDLSEREVYARLSDVMDGRFTARSPSGDIELLPNVIAHALGAALLRHLDDTPAETFDALDSELKKWLDPIGSLDEPSEVLRAAVSILVEQGRTGTGSVPGVLVTAWLQSQNVPDAHRREIGDLAPRLTSALLDAVEHSESHVHNSARLWAVNGLRNIPRTDKTSLSTIVDRACCWLRTVFRDINLGPNAQTEHNEWRSTQLKKRIGTDSTGEVTVLGLTIELSDTDHRLIQEIIPSIIEGFPFSRVTPIFRVAATALAVSGGSPCWDALRWLCLINEVDPEDTAKELRQLSRLVGCREPEPCILADLPVRVAALLLWLTGKEDDEVAASSMDPRTDHLVTYERDYLPNPSRSTFPLERRHAEDVLRDSELPLLRRVERIGDLWLDPSFSPQTESFQHELRSFVEKFDVSKLYQNRNRTIEEHHFELLEPALARCAPQLLGDLIRRNVRSIAFASGESWYWRSIHATEHILLADDHDFDWGRMDGHKGAEGDEYNVDYATSRRLLLDIIDAGAKSQFERIIDAELKFISIDFAQILHPLTLEDVDGLVTQYKDGTEKQQRQLVTLFSIESRALTDRAWSWLETLTRLEDKCNTRGLSFKTLARSDLRRFGEFLLKENWSWSPADDVWASHYGSLALIEAMRRASIDELVSKIAPWMLLEAARIRGEQPAEVRLASEVLSRTLLASGTEAPDPGSDLTVDIVSAADMPFLYSLGLRPSGSELEQFQTALDPDAQLKALRLAIDTAAARIQEARNAGAELYLATFSSKAFAAVIKTAPDIIEKWLEGASEPTVDFRRRVCLAEGAFIALCEALLECRPTQGVKLWRALRECIVTRYVGKVGVEELIHILFRAPDSPEIVAVREEIAGIDHCCTDQGLMDLAIAELVNPSRKLLDSTIQKNRESTYVWRQLQAVILEGFVKEKSLPVCGAWPEGEIKTERARIAQFAARAALGNACARYWWEQYLDSSDPVEAYSFWVLFVRSVDRRVWVWWEAELAGIRGISGHFRRKIIHASLNRDKVKRAARKREDKFDQYFLRKRIVQNIGPWC